VNQGGGTVQSGCSWQGNVPGEVLFLFLPSASLYGPAKDSQVPCPFGPFTPWPCISVRRVAK